MKKSISILSLINETNLILALPNLSQDEKQGASHILHYALHASGNYSGFGYNFHWPQPDESNYDELYKQAKLREFDRKYYINSKLLSKKH